MAWDPAEDGVTHLNVYSKAQTDLGRWLSNFTRSWVNTEDGPFASIEAYWYWLGTDSPRREELRGTHGFRSKQLGRELRAPDWTADPVFRRKILAAITAKLQSEPSRLDELASTDLPLVHYYVYGGKVVEPSEGSWMLEHLEEARRERKNEKNQKKLPGPLDSGHNAVR